jgi:hypothetical protein
MDQHLRITFDPLVKLLVCRRRFLDVDLMRYHEARLRLARYNHVSEIPVVGLYVALPGTDRQSLKESLAKA